MLSISALQDCDCPGFQIDAKPCSAVDAGEQVANEVLGDGTFGPLERGSNRARADSRRELFPLKHEVVWNNYAVLVDGVRHS